MIGKAPKFYLFDVGVAGAIAKRHIPEARGDVFGKAFEHFILMELSAHASHSELNYYIQFWRTKSGLEVDFILGQGEVAVEVKGFCRLDDRELRPLSAFAEEHKPRQAVLVCNETAERNVRGLRVMPWRAFLAALWAGEFMR